MPQKNTRKVTEHENGQLRITIPSGLAAALGYKKGDRILFEINGKGRLELSPVKEAHG